MQRAVKEYEDEIESARKRGDAGSMGGARSIMLQWYPELVKAVRREQEEVRRGGMVIDRPTGEAPMIRWYPGLWTRRIKRQPAKPTWPVIDRPTRMAGATRAEQPHDREGHLRCAL
jgi:DNA-directed RNA polymerase N-terminal